MARTDTDSDFLFNIIFSDETTFQLIDILIDTIVDIIDDLIGELSWVGGGECEKITLSIHRS